MMYGEKLSNAFSNLTEQDNLRFLASYFSTLNRPYYIYSDNHGTDYAY